MVRHKVSRPAGGFASYRPSLAADQYPVPSFVMWGHAGDVLHFMTS